MVWRYFFFYSIFVMISWLILIYLTLLYVPSDAKQGIAQRIFYYHVPTAWVSFTGFLFGSYYSFLYLKNKNFLNDIKALSFNSLAYLFTSGVLITGPLWAKPIWGDFWNWSDERLVTFFILWLSYSAYFLLRYGIPDKDKKARFSAILSLLALVNIPLVYLSILIWETPSHPGPVIGKGGLKNPTMAFTFWYSLLCFHLLFIMLYIPTYVSYKLQLKKEL